MSIEQVRTPEEILREAVATVYGQPLAGAHQPTRIEKQLAVETAAGELAQALLRRRVRELEGARGAPKKTESVYLGLASSR